MRLRRRIGVGGGGVLVQGAISLYLPLTADAALGHTPGHGDGAGDGRRPALPAHTAAGRLQRGAGTGPAAYPGDQQQVSIWGGGSVDGGWEKARAEREQTWDGGGSVTLAELPLTMCPFAATS